jgi:uncharacterized small protein (DUF1192 family)
LCLRGKSCRRLSTLSPSLPLSLSLFLSPAPLSLSPAPLSLSLNHSRFSLPQGAALEEELALLQREAARLGADAARCADDARAAAAAREASDSEARAPPATLCSTYCGFPGSSSKCVGAASIKLNLSIVFTIRISWRCLHQSEPFLSYLS